jgi:conjugative transposon TraM protein
MEMFKQQMAYMDSINKTNDPAFKAEKLKKEEMAKAEARHSTETVLPVTRAADVPSDFNTVTPGKTDGFIKVIIDENLTGYAGSRVMLKLLDDINVGRNLVSKGAYLYALVTGFSGQRVILSVRSVLADGKLLPVKLEIYDLDGLPGLYVPQSAFRDFTKDLGTNTVQGITLDNSSTGSAATQLMMSTASKLFESTSTAIAGMIRKNKANIKYNTYLYLIDDDALQNAQNREGPLSAGKK